MAPVDDPVFEGTAEEEADVVIVSRGGRKSASAPAVPERVASAAPAQKRKPAIDADEYFAYRGFVEEARVEIVLHTTDSPVKPTEPAPQSRTERPSSGSLFGKTPQHSTKPR